MQMQCSSGSYKLECFALRRSLCNGYWKVISQRGTQITFARPSKMVLS